MELVESNLEEHDPSNVSSEDDKRASGEKKNK